MGGGKEDDWRSPDVLRTWRGQSGVRGAETRKRGGSPALQGYQGMIAGRSDEDRPIIPTNRLFPGPVTLRFLIFPMLRGYCPASLGLLPLSHTYVRYLSSNSYTSDQHRHRDARSDHKADLLSGEKGIAFVSQHSRQKHGCDVVHKYLRPCGRLFFFLSSLIFRLTSLFFFFFLFFLPPWRGKTNVKVLERRVANTRSS